VVGIARVTEGEGRPVEVADGIGVAVAVGAATPAKLASSKHASDSPAGHSMSRTRAEVAAAGARMGPVAREVHAADVASALSCCSMLAPLPSAAVYQLTLIDAAPGPTTRALAEAAYHVPPTMGTSWWSHLVESVADWRQAE
jgi:hypothetical protein